VRLRTGTALERVTVDGTKVRAGVNKKMFSRAHKIGEHLKLARGHVEQLQKEKAEQEKRTWQAAARRRAARERVERLEAARVEVERLQAEKKWDRDKPCQTATSGPDAQFLRTGDHGLAPAYNVPLATDAKHKPIVEVEVSIQPSGSLPALDRLKQRLGAYPRQAVADGDYTNREAILGAVRRGVDYSGSWTETREEWMAHGIGSAYPPSASA
jgi:hypothetical protein